MSDNIKTNDKWGENVINHLSDLGILTLDKELSKFNMISHASYYLDGWNFMLQKENISRETSFGNYYLGLSNNMGDVSNEEYEYILTQVFQDMVSRQDVLNEIWESRLWNNKLPSQENGLKIIDNVSNYNIKVMDNHNKNEIKFSLLYNGREIRKISYEKKSGIHIRSAANYMYLNYSYPSRIINESNKFLKEYQQYPICNVIGLLMVNSIN